MNHPSARPIIAAAIFVAGPAFAGSVDAVVKDGDGMPAPNTVVVLRADATPDAEALRRLPAEAVIDQRDEMFIPLVSIVRRGGRVIFANHDTTIHQVYSFSPIKQFEFEVDEGQRSPPVVFDKAGIASVGCNIHDHMITYVYVADSPWTMMTDAKGEAHFLDLPPGRYSAEAWNPQSTPGSAPPHASVTVGDGKTDISLAVSVMSGMMPGMKHKHQQSY